MSATRDDHPRLRVEYQKALLHCRSKWKIKAAGPGEDYGSASLNGFDYRVRLKTLDDHPIIQLGAPKCQGCEKVLGELIVLLEMATWREGRVVMFFDLLDQGRAKPENSDFCPSFIKDQLDNGKATHTHWYSPPLDHISRFECLRSLSDQPIGPIAHALLPHEWTEISRFKMKHKSGFDLSMKTPIDPFLETRVFGIWEYYHRYPKRARLGRFKCFPKPTRDLDWDVPSPKIVNIWDDRVDRVAFWASSDWLQLERWIPQWLWLQTHCGTDYIRNLHGF